MKKLLYLTLFFTAFTNAQIVNIPDANFKVKLLQADVTNEIAYGNGGYIKIDANNDGEIQETEAQVVDSLNIPQFDIVDLTGISGFYNLKKLNCFNNQLSTLNVSSLSSLRILNCAANNLTVLDTSNLNNLLILECNSNFIGDLNLNNLISLNYLDCSSNQINTLDVSNLLNLNYLNCSQNLISNPIIFNSINLTFLNCSSNLISNLIISNSTNLNSVDCSYNALTSLNINGLTSLEYLKCSNNQISNLITTSNINLIQLDCSNNLITSLNLSNSINLAYLHCYRNLISTLDLSGLTSLYVLYASDINPNPLGALASLNVSGCTNLYVLYLDNNQLTQLDVSGCTSLYGINVTNNQLTTIDLSTNQNLYFIDGENNQFTSLDFSNCPNFNHAYIGGNQLSYLDFSNCPNFETAYLENNQLVILNIKNGHSTYANTINNSNLQFVCADENEILSFMQSNSSFLGVINSYCSFTPGGNYNTIIGTLTYDADNDGCDSNDSVFPYIRMNMTQWGINNSTFTNQSGNYTFYTTFADQSVSPQLENPTYFTISPQDATISFPDNNNNTATQNFCITPNGVHPDLEIVIAPITPARPGFDAVYEIVYKNIGNQVMSQQYGINFFYDENVFDFVSTTYPTSSSGLGSLSWDYENLQPFESRSFYVTLNVNSPVETPPVNINDILTLTASILPSSGDENTLNNLFQFNQTVVGSYDPNDITCIEGNVVPTSQIGNYLHYIINFENTGTAQAENIVVKTEIDPNQFDINSLQLLNASHEVDARITDNKVEFIFQQIMLDTGGHGNVLLKIRSKDNLQQGDVVSKQANIYFDYNAPIDTNFANTTFQTLSNSIHNLDNSISVSPNPTNSIVNIKSDFNINSVQLFDVQGRLLQSKLQNETSLLLDISNQSNGIYFLKINSEKGSKVEKIVKE